MATKRVIELDERTTLDMNDYLLVDSQTSTRKLAMSTLFNYMTLTTIVFVTELPTTDISESTIYLLPHSGSNTQWDEYVYRDGAWVIIGTSTIDLSAIYQTKTDNTLLTIAKTIVGGINELFGRLRANNNNFTAAYSDGKYGFTIDNQFYELGGGGSMKCAKFGTVLPTTTGAVIDISDLNLTSTEDYMVVCDGTGYSQGTSHNSTVFIENKTATSFTIKAGFAAPTNNNLVSYQVITFN